MKDIIKNTIGRIKKGNIRPEPRWKYLAKKYSVWMFFLIVAFIGAVALAVGYFVASQLDWDLYRAAHRNPFFYFFSILPHIWIILFISLAFLAFFNLRKTENGYRYNFSKIILAVLGSLLAFGFLMTLFGFGGKISASITRGFPGYGKLVTTKESQWSQPEKGFLAGTINSVSENSLDLQDLAGKEWQIDYDKNTDIRPSVTLESGEMIKTIGQKENERIFRASEIRPWQGRGKMSAGNGKKNGTPNESGGSKGMMNGRGE
jgi:tryptophan-rich sensory protein